MPRKALFQVFFPRKHFVIQGHRVKLAYPLKICPFCRKEFSTRRETRNNKFCSERCSRLARRKYDWVDKICEHCRKLIKYSSRNPRQRFCSVLCQIKNRAYKVDEKFFDKINSEAKAYILGLVFSDGSISKQRLSFSSVDRKIVRGQDTNCGQLEKPKNEMISRFLRRN